MPVGCSGGHSQCLGDFWNGHTNEIAEFYHLRGHRIFDTAELDDIVLHPPLQRFLRRWQPGDPAVYLGALWAP